MDFTRFLTKITNRRKPNMLRSLAKSYMENPKAAITLANGMPNAETFPFEEITVTYKGGCKKCLTGKELSMALQYGPSEGHIPLVKKMVEYQERCHRPSYDDWEIVFTSGSQDGCSKITEVIVESGDTVMLQNPAYPGTIAVISQTGEVRLGYVLVTNGTQDGLCKSMEAFLIDGDPLRPYDVELIEIDQDEDGIIPEIIEKACAEKVRAGKPLPKVLYVNPTGANPTGTILSESRRRRVYELAQKYDFLIIEDDPYYFITFLDRRPITFFELDTDGRVIRLDSFSKILSAGLRLGLVTAHKKLITKLMLHIESSTMHASSLSQMLLYKLFDTWGFDKFEAHIKDVQEFYRKRRDNMLRLLDRHFTGLATWTVPNGGMFVWIKVLGIEDVVELTTKKCIPAGVFVLPGQAFNYDTKKKSSNIRLCYSFASVEDIDKALSIVAKLAREELAFKGM